MNARERATRWVAVCEAPFLPACDGGQREHLGLVRALARRGGLAGLVVCVPGQVDLSLYRAEVGDVPVLLVRRRTSPDVHLRPVTPFVWASRRPAPATADALLALIRGCQPDAVLACSFKSAELAHELAHRAALPLVLREHNVESTYHRDLGRARRGVAAVYYRLESARIARAERRLRRRSRLRGVAEISSVDQGRRGPPSVASCVIPPFAVEWPPAGGEVGSGPRQGVVFLGALDVATNQDALRWLLDTVWPLVLRRDPTAQLTVAGRRPDPAFSATLTGRPGVRVLVDVPDAASLLRSALVAVNPTVSGSGINIKLVEYAAAETAVVATSRSVAGLPPFDRGALDVADDPQTFADHVVELLADPAATRLRGRELGRELAPLFDGDRSLDLLEGFVHPRVKETSR